MDGSLAGMTTYEHDSFELCPRLETLISDSYIPAVFSDPDTRKFTLSSLESFTYISPHNIPNQIVIDIY